MSDQESYVAEIMRDYNDGLYTDLELPHALLRALAASSEPLDDYRLMPISVQREVWLLANNLMPEDDVVAVNIDVALLKRDAARVREILASWFSVDEADRD